jgi:hypothetical protein
MLVIRVAVVIVAAATAAAVVMIVVTVIIVVVVVNYYLFMCKLVCFSHTNACSAPALICSIAHVVSRSLE